MSEHVLNSFRMLLADDDASIRNVFRMLVEQHYRHVVVDLASNGAEAIRLFEELRHPVVITDLNMPGIDGLAVWQAIMDSCAERGEEEPYVVFCTGFVPPDSLKTALARSRKSSLLMKPVAVARLYDRLDMIIREMAKPLVTR